ncbi:hypothetical protein Taro_006553, partial [Colocasia esculenta]|nr:hypothetical protein [Colocasia esculenta]
VRLHSSTFHSGLKRRGHSKGRLPPWAVVPMVRSLVRAEGPGIGAVTVPFRVFGPVGGGVDGQILGESRGSGYRGRHSGIRARDLSRLVMEISNDVKSLRKYK